MSDVWLQQFGPVPGIKINKTYSWDSRGYYPAHYLISANLYRFYAAIIKRTVVFSLGLFTKNKKNKITSPTTTSNQDFTHPATPQERPCAAESSLSRLQKTKPAVKFYPN